VTAILSPRFVVDERYVLHGIPSASGMAIIDDALYVVGDNSPWLFKINHQGQILDRILLWPHAPLTPEGIYPKKLKPDLESLATMQEDGITLLLMLGSGSLAPTRDIWTEVRLGEVPVITTHALTEFYAALRMHTGLTAEQLNIEAVEVIGDELLLFNRGVNLVLRYRLSEVRKFLIDGKDCPIPAFTRLLLPIVSGIEAGLSGAALLPGTRQVIFTASVEDTTNWIDDGAVLGSFIGVFHLDHLYDGLQPTCTPLDDKQLKIESVAVVSNTAQCMADLLLVSDADGGLSELIKGKLYWQWSEL